MMSRSTLTLLACIAPLHALTPPKSHAAPTPSARRRNHQGSTRKPINVRGGGDNATDALLVRGGTGKKRKKPRKKRGGRRWPTYGSAGRDRSRRVTPKVEEAPVVETPVAKDFNQLKEVPQSWIDRTINFLEAPVTELLIGATAVSLSLMEIQRQIIELGTREADYSVLFLAATRMLKAFLAARMPRLTRPSPGCERRVASMAWELSETCAAAATPSPRRVTTQVLRSTRMALRGYKSYAVIKKGENVYLKKIPATDDDAGVV